MKLVFLYGMPGVGKLTVARELSALTGLPLFHNHLAVDLALALFDFGTKPFVELRESVWHSSFQQAVDAELPGLIFTFAFDRSVGQAFIERTQQIVTAGHGEVVFVELKCSEVEVEKRLTDPSRITFGKLNSLSFFRELERTGAFVGPVIPPGGFSLDITDLPPAQAARMITEMLGLPALERPASADTPAQSAYDEWATTYDADVNRTRDLDAAVMKGLLSEQRFKSVVELGCGTGKNTEFLASRSGRLIAVDFSEPMLQRARAKILDQGITNVTFHAADITTTWPVTDQSADLIICNLVLEHVRDLSAVFREVSRCLTLDGRFLICELHPFRQYLGIKANFNRSGQQFKIQAFTHDLSEFVDAGEVAGLALERLQEWWHDDDKDKPPRLLSLRFRKD